MARPVKDFEETLAVSPDLLKDLDTFITQPESRMGDVLVERNFPVQKNIVLNWLIKHDLFEGVLMHLTLLDIDAYEHLGTADAAISSSEEIFGTYQISWKGTTYTLHVVQSS